MESLLNRVDELIRARYPLLYLVSWEEERVERNLRRFAGDNDYELYRWRSTEGMVKLASGEVVEGSGELSGAIAALDEVTTPAILLISEPHVISGDPKLSRAIRDRIDNFGARRQAILITNPSLVIPSDLNKEMMILDVPLPNDVEIERLVRALLRRMGNNVDEGLVDRFVQSARGLTERETKRALVRVANGEGGFSEEDLRRLIEVKEQTIRRTRFVELQSEVPAVSEVGGLGNLKQWLRRRGRAFEPSARSYGLPEPKGVFFLGVQGCGKSLMAKAVASIFKLPLIRLDVAEVFRGDGRHQESLQETIRIAESISPAVLWIDELEKAFSKSGGASSQALGVLLTWLQEKTKPVYVVATANEVRGLPPELLRKGRFDEIFFVDLPNVHERLEILQIHLARRGRDPEQFDLLQCAEETEKYSGAELEQVIIEAMYNAFADNERDILSRDLLTTIRDTVPLAITMDEHLKELREWARPRTRPASLDRRRIDFFDDFME